MQGLPITRAGLRLDTDPDTSAAHQRIPRSPVARVRQWHLQPAVPALVEERSDALQQRGLRRVAMRVGSGSRCQAEIQAHPSKQRAKIRKMEALVLSSLDPGHPARRPSDDACQLPLAETGGDPGEASVLADSAQGDAGDPPTAVDRPLANAHLGMLTATSYRPGAWRFTAQRLPFHHASPGTTPRLDRHAVDCVITRVRTTHDQEA